MTTIFIANVGNHDVNLSDGGKVLLPDNLRDGHAPARTLGAELEANFGRYARHIELPLIGVSLRWLIDEQRVDPAELFVHLFPSDQPAPPVTPMGEWLKDTGPFAQVVKRYLTSGAAPMLAAKHVHMHTIKGNPANYRNMLEFFTAKLAWLVDKHVHEDDTIYLEITGGTPAMTSMLLLAGFDALGEQAETLYVERGADRPRLFGIGRALLHRQALRQLREQINLHAYLVARETLQNKGELIAPDLEKRNLLAAILRYAQSRLAFDFDRARQALTAANQYAAGEVQSTINYWDRQLKDPDEAALLGELLHSARINFQMGDYAAFSQRVFRFQEAALRALAERMGMRYKSKRENEFVDKKWVASVPGLTDFLSDYTAPDGARYKPVDLDRSLNRINLGAIVAFFVQHRKEWARYKDAADTVQRLSAVAKLRNKGLAGHGFVGIARADLSSAFGRDASEILPLMEETCEDLFGHKIGQSPYEAANKMLLDLIQS